MQQSQRRLAAPMIRRSRSAFVALVVLSFSVRCIGDGLREDELECERAAVRVADCCPGTPSIASACGYIEGDDACLGAPPVDPILRRSQSVCLQSASCASVVAGGVCAAIEAAAAAGSAGRGGADAGVGGAAGQSPLPTRASGDPFVEDREPLQRKALREALEGRTLCP